MLPLGSRFFFQMNYIIGFEMMLQDTRNSSGANLLWQKVRTQDVLPPRCSTLQKKVVEGQKNTCSKHLTSCTWASA